VFSSGEVCEGSDAYAAFAAQLMNADCS